MKRLIAMVAMVLATNSMFIHAQQKDTAILHQITIYPNPFYDSRSEPHVKGDSIFIRNLPSSTTFIEIYTLNGKLVRLYELKNQPHEIAWDLKNDSGTKICTGLYIIQVKTSDLGDKILKCYVVMAPTMSTF